MSASDGRTNREMSTVLGNAMAEAGARPVNAVRVDADRVIEIANAINITLFPMIQLAADRDREELAQLIALIMVAESRFREMDIAPEGRVNLLKAALTIMGKSKRREIHDLAGLSAVQAHPPAPAKISEAEKTPQADDGCRCPPGAEPGLYPCPVHSGEELV